MDDFVEKVQEVESHDVHRHSLFSEERTLEKRKFLESYNTKIILAWGQDDRIKNLAKPALTKISHDKQTFGLRVPGKSWGYRHPHPMLKKRCIEWLLKMKKQLTENNRDITLENRSKKMDSPVQYEGLTCKDF